MTLKDLEDKIYDIVDSGDELLSAQDKADMIIKEVLN
jgi:hypothetical protein